jgi:hypothetical protein
MNDDEQRRFVTIWRQRIQHPPRQRRFARADLANQQSQALHRIGRVRQSRQGFGMLRTIVVKTAHWSV